MKEEVVIKEGERTLMIPREPEEFKESEILEQIKIVKEEIATMERNRDASNEALLVHESKLQKLESQIAKIETVEKPTKGSLETTEELK